MFVEPPGDDLERLTTPARPSATVRRRGSRVITHNTRSMSSYRVWTFGNDRTDEASVEVECLAETTLIDANRFPQE